jgi:hypothetical protein
MSRVRISNVPGGWIDEGEGFARTQGYGGEMVVSAPTPGVKNDRWITSYHQETPAERKKAQQRQWKERSRERRREARIHVAGCAKDPGHRSDCKSARILCDRPLRKQNLGNCARTKDHAGPHQSRQSLDRENRLRRNWRDGVAA